MMFKQPLTASVFFSVHWRDGAALSTGADHRLAITWPSPGHRLAMAGPGVAAIIKPAQTGRAPAEGKPL